MAAEQSDQEVRTGVNRGGSTVSDIPISQARVMAVRTAQASGERRLGFLRRRMLFEVLSDHEDEDSYTIVLSFHPQGEFEGTPGQERFKFSKAGRFQDREVLSQPKYSKRIRIKRKTVMWGAVGVLAVIVIVAIIFVLSGDYERTCGSPYCDRDSSLPHADSVTLAKFSTDSTVDSLTLQNVYLR